MKTNLPVSVVITTYNGSALLKANLPAVFDCCRSGDEVVIVDDASRDETVDWVTDKFNLKKEVDNDDFVVWTGSLSEDSKKLQIVLIANCKNVRFGATSNRGVKLAQHPIVFLLNNDVIPSREVIAAALPHFKDDQVFAVGCHEIEKNQGGISSGKNKHWFERGMFVHSRADNFETGETGWASGGSAFFDREKWLELGGFDKAYYPAYEEDIDLSFRAKKRGWKVLFEKEAMVVHNHETTNTTVFGRWQIAVMSFKNAITFLWRNGTTGQKIQHLIWLPYHLVFTSWRTRGAFLRGLVRFLYS